LGRDLRKKAHLIHSGRRAAPGRSVGSLALLAALVLPGCASLRTSPGASKLRVATYNIRSGNGDLARTAEAIRAIGADIIALQEVDVHWSERSGFADQASELGGRLKMQVRFARIYDLPNADSTKPRREFGVAVLSRYPIVRFANDTITRLSTQVQNPTPQAMPGLLEADIDVAGRLIRVFNTHLDYRSDPAVRTIQVQEIVRHLGDVSQPMLLFGDLNAEADARELQPLFAHLEDSWKRGQGAGLTYPSENPTKRIDFVLASRHFETTTARVAVTQASDHRPVIVDLIVKPAD
jgi:endonuclease/exonuclease/phosphatase family metal-dependent hydrolase